MTKTALITGITGHDGAYLAEFLLKKGYIVHGIKRRASLFNTDRIDHLYQDPHVDNRNFILHHGDLSDSSNLFRIIQEVQPDEIYNLAAMSHVAASPEDPDYTANADGIGTLRILEAIRILGIENKTRFYQASTSELYGLVWGTPQEETTLFYPRTRAHQAQSAGLPLTRQYKFTLRDRGHARDYVEMQRLMLQQDPPIDIVTATGVQYSVGKFVDAVARELGTHITWQGQSVEDEIRHGFTVRIPDGQLFRASSIDPKVAHAYDARRSFINQRLTAVTSEQRQRLASAQQQVGP
ncbi:GDP-mannose 4,6-dehydratase [Accumulibacter sp.]|uniref:GDP-mannose 4,6-dehydratase n=1 Tax=Accumulibacter sp. TaxID=2053492 RepID=UPI002638731B|nr:GDP-mannose 4,6-dehydratase [Accumulibacter sp.]